MGDWFTPLVWMDTNFTTSTLFTQSSLKTSRSWSMSIWMCSYTWIIMSGTWNHFTLWCLVQGQCKNITKSIPVYAQSSYLVFVIQHVQHVEDCHFIKHFSNQCRNYLVKFQSLANKFIRDNEGAAVWQRCSSPQHKSQTSPLRTSTVVNGKCVVWNGLTDSWEPL